MKKLGLGFAYLCIYTTPIQLGFIAWQIFIITSSEYSILSMSTKDFLVDNIRFLHDWIYSWFWNDFLNFIWALPAAIMVTLKLLINTWIGFWLLPIAKKLNQTGIYD